MTCEEFEISQNQDEAFRQNLLEIRRTTKPCPRCRARIKKEGGCNHMACSSCKFRFQWNTVAFDGEEKPRSAETADGDDTVPPLDPEEAFLVDMVNRFENGEVQPQQRAAWMTTRHEEVVRLQPLPDWHPDLVIHRNLMMQRDAEHRAGATPVPEAHRAGRPAWLLPRPPPHRDNVVRDRNTTTPPAPEQGLRGRLLGGPGEWWRSLTPRIWPERWSFTNPSHDSRDNSQRSAVALPSTVRPSRETVVTAEFSAQQEMERDHPLNILPTSRIIIDLTAESDEEAPMVGRRRPARLR